MSTWLTTADCARQIGVPTRYIYEEVLAGRLAAIVVPRSPAQGRMRGNRRIRIDADVWRVYVAAQWPERRVG